MARGLHRYADRNVRWNFASWKSVFPETYRSTDIITARANGIMVVGSRTSGTDTSEAVTLPRGDYRFFIVGGGGGAAYKYTKGTVSKYQTDYYKVSSGKYSLAGGGSGAVAVVDIHFSAPTAVNILAGSCGTYANNSTTKASNGGDSSIYIPSTGAIIACGGGGGGKANDGSSGTVGAAGVFDKSGSGYTVVYSSNGKAGTRRYLTTWNNYEGAWPEAFGGMYSADNRAMTFTRDSMSNVIAIPQEHFMSLYGTDYRTFLNAETNADSSYYVEFANSSMLHYDDDQTLPSGDILIAAGSGGCASMWIWGDSSNPQYDGNKKAGIGIVVVERIR